MTKNKKYLIIFSLIILFILVVVIITANIPKTKILFSIAPETAKIEINNKIYDIKNGDLLNFKPGEYNYKIYREGFEEYKNSIKLEEGKQTELLSALKPTTEEARKLLLNEKSQIIIQRFYGIHYSEAINSISKEYPLIDILPIQARLYTVSACKSIRYPGDNSKIAVCAEITSDQLKPYVIKDIESRGYNIDDYELIWTSVTPLGE